MTSRVFICIPYNFVSKSIYGLFYFDNIHQIIYESFTSYIAVYIQIQHHPKTFSYFLKHLKHCKGAQ